ncbi:hypothetical protein A5855_002125, partial [Enterococcus faecium]
VTTNLKRKTTRKKIKRKNTSTIKTVS